MVPCLPSPYDGDVLPLKLSELVVGGTAVFSLRTDPGVYLLASVAARDKRSLKLTKCIRYSTSGFTVAQQSDSKDVTVLKADVQFAWKIVPRRVRKEPPPPKQPFIYAGESLLSLALEVLEKVADFAGPSNLGCTCRKLFETIHGRHLCLCMKKASCAPVLSHLMIRSAPQLRTLTLNVHTSDILQQIPFAELSLAPNLGLLHLILFNCHLHEDSALAIMRVAHAPLLCGLIVEMEEGSCAASALDTLSELTSSPALRYLSLSVPLAPDYRMFAAVKSFAVLKDILNLNTLHLNLGGCGLKRAGIQFISALAQSSTIEVLGLDLSKNDLQQGDLTVIQQLVTMPRLTELWLELTENELTVEDALSISKLANAPNLKLLNILLAANDLGMRGFTTLALLTTSSSLETMDLDLQCNAIKGEIYPVLQKFITMPSLRTFSLDVSGNAISDLPDCILSFKNATQLQELNFSCSGMYNADITRAKMQLKKSCTIPRLTIAVDT